MTFATDDRGEGLFKRDRRRSRAYEWIQVLGSCQFDVCGLETEDEIAEAIRNVLSEPITAVMCYPARQVAAMRKLGVSDSEMIAYSRMGGLDAIIDRLEKEGFVTMENPYFLIRFLKSEQHVYAPRPTDQSHAFYERLIGLVISFSHRKGA